VGQAAPIKAMEGCVAWDLGVVLKSTQVDLTLAQLLNDSPKLRKQLTLLLRSSNPRTRRRKPNAMAVRPMHNTPLASTCASDDVGDVWPTESAEVCGIG